MTGRRCQPRIVEAPLVDALGPESTASKSTVSRICEAIKNEFDTWRTRDLSGVELGYFLACRGDQDRKSLAHCHLLNSTALLRIRDSPARLVLSRTRRLVEAALGSWTGNFRLIDGF